MIIDIKAIENRQYPEWDAYVVGHSKSTLYQHSGWLRAINAVYRHDVFMLVAKENRYKISGVLPIACLRGLLFDKTLVSIPYFDFSGLLADHSEIEKQLLAEALHLCKRIGAKAIELRHSTPRDILDENKLNTLFGSIQIKCFQDKIRMVMALPGSSHQLMASFKSKLRSQIKKPIKEGLYAKVGRHELLEDFYNVFSINMRDLGSPVHSKELIRQVIEQFPGKARIVMVYKGKLPIACSLIVGFKDILENPWASALRKFSKLSPNMLLYWTMLEYACDNGYSYFDFGRSSPYEGTYRFKKQWGAIEQQLYWYYIYPNGMRDDIVNIASDKSKFDVAIQYWKKLPVPITRLIGPPIRKHIGL